MVLTRSNNGWTRSGCTILWSTELLGRVCKPTEVVSVRQLFTFDKWPELLPSCDGNALVVAGLEGCIDILSLGDSERWVEQDLKDRILSFQDEFEGQAGLIFWVPSGKGRISMEGGSEEYFWKHSEKTNPGMHLGRLLYAGAENEVERILDSTERDADYDGKAWAGLYHRWIS